MKLNRKALEAILFGNVWVYGPMDMMEDRWGKMAFLLNGRIFGYDHPNEYGWDFANGAFRLLRKDGEPTSIFEEAFVDNGRMQLKGRSMEPPNSLYSLQQADPTED